MIKRLLNRILFIFCILVSVVVSSILVKKDNFRATYTDLNITYLPDNYKFIDFLFGWPILFAIVLGTGWLVWMQFNIESVIKKLKINALFLLVLFCIAMVWLSIVYIPFYSAIS